MNELAFRNFIYGLFVLGAGEGDNQSGCIINTAQQVTVDPASITFCVNNTGHTCKLLKETGKFTLSVLDESAIFDLFRHFGFQSGRDVDKWTDWKDKKQAENGVWYNTQGANTVFAGTVMETLDLGTHTLFIARVEQAEILSDEASASYTYYHMHIKPQPQAPEKTEGRVAWRCTICGYIYDEPVLPADYICPLCKHPASDFEKITL